MKILFLTRRKWPEIGGVERHIECISANLGKKNNTIKTITEKDINYPKVKYLGLLFIWTWLYMHKELIKEADVWYLPFRFLYPNKKVVTTIHGLEWDKPLHLFSLWQKRLAAKLSNKSVGIGIFLNKYTRIKFDLVSYGAFDLSFLPPLKKIKNSVVYVGRLEKNTGLMNFLKWLKRNNKKNKYFVDFCGDGGLREECEKYGTVHGFSNPELFVRRASICIPGGYLAALEAMVAKCKVMVFWDNPVKKNYWQMTPFYKWIKEGNIHAAYEWARKQTWDKLADEYLDLYNRSK
jgi:glycosyltransferase involved in cell wall biosynthesis